MSNKLITLWSLDAGSGRRTLTQLLMREIIEAGSTGVIVDMGSSRPPLKDEFTVSDTNECIQRFKTLSPALFRNYLSRPEGGAHLHLPRIPSVEESKDLWRLLKNAFEWTLAISPIDFSPETITLLDATDSLFWLNKAGTDTKEALKKPFAQLAGLHYPHALSQVLLTRHVPASKQKNSVDSGIAGKKWLVVLPEDAAPSLRLKQTVREFYKTLQTRDDLYSWKAPVGVTKDPKKAEEAIQEIRARVHPKLMSAMKEQEGPAQGAPAGEQRMDLAQKTLETYLAENSSAAATREERQEIFTRVLDEVMGLGPIEPLLKDPEVSEVMVNNRTTIFVEKKGRLYPTNVQFADDAQLRTVIDRIVSSVGRRVDESMPLCDARLADGSRVNIVLPPLALDGPALTIRKFGQKSLTFNDFIRLGSLSQEMADFLHQCVIRKKNIVIAGGTGSGKTTLLNALSGLIPSEERIVTIEDAAELRLQKPHVVRLESRPVNAEGQGAIPIRHLVINALRMRPDRIVVGECRGGEALDMLQAMNTGHDGSLTTVHANSPRDALGRLETLVLMAGIDLPVRVVREQIRSAVHLIVQQSRMGDGSRKVTSITEITGMEDGILLSQEIFGFRQHGLDGEGRIMGEFQNTGIVPTFMRPMNPLGNRL